MIVCLFLGILCVLYGICVLRIASGTMFFMVWFAIGACLLLLGLGIRAHLIALLPRAVKAMLLILIAAGLVALCTTWILIGTHFHDKGNNNIDYLIVLGAQVKIKSQDEVNDPALDHKGRIAPSTVLQYRLETALEYLESHPATVCIVSGGKSPLEPEPEGDVMSDWLIERGIDPDRVLIENQSTNTVENIQNSLRLVEGSDISIGIVTNNFHVFRGVSIAKKAVRSPPEGSPAITGVYGIAAPSHVFYLPNNMLRESMGIVKDFLYRNI